MYWINLLRCYDNTLFTFGDKLMSVWNIIVLIFAIIIYVLPGVIASSREHKNATAIWVLNIVLGWSFLGWIAALVWSFTNPGVVKLEPQVFGADSAGILKNVRIAPEAILCRFCGRHRHTEKIMVLISVLFLTACLQKRKP
jgi:hypothetical protein